MLTTMTVKLLALFFTAGVDQPFESGNLSNPVSSLQKLCDAAWAPRPEQFDMLLYRVRTLRQVSREETRQQVKEWLAAAYPEGYSTEAEHEELVEANIENIMKERSAPRRIIQRILQDGERQRVDMVILKPGQDAGNARLSDWYITLGHDADPHGRNAIQVTGEVRTARILPDGMRFAGTPIEDWISVPFKPVMQMMFGAPEESGRFSRSEERVRSFLSGTSGLTLSVTRVDDPRYSSGPLDRVEILDGQSGQVRVAMLCDHEHYGRTYEFAVYEPASGKRTVLMTRRAHLPNGVPTKIESNTYDDSGLLVEADRVFFLRADFNPAFKPADFELRAPLGYGLVDARKTPDELMSLPDPLSAEAGYTVKDLLATPPDSIVRENLAQVGIPLPGSGPDPK